MIVCHGPTVASKWNKRQGLGVAPFEAAAQATPEGSTMGERANFAAELARRRAAAGLSLAALAVKAHAHRGYLGNVEHGKRWPTATVVRGLDAALDADGDLLAAWEAADRVPHNPGIRNGDWQSTELLELAARAEASDVSPPHLTSWTPA